MAITYTRSKLEILCHPEELVVGRIEARDAILLTKEHIDDGFQPPLYYTDDDDLPDAVLYAEGNEIPEGKDVGDVKIPAKKVGDYKGLMQEGDEMFPPIAADEATDGFIVPAQQYMTYLDVEYTGTDSDTGLSASYGERVTLKQSDEIDEADFMQFADVTEEWVDTRVAQWYSDADVERNISQQLGERKALSVAVAKPWD